MSNLRRIKCKSREEWLQRRAEINGIGASDCSAIVGMSSWKTARDLWNEKVGITKPKDLSDNEQVQKGIRVEPALRELFKANHPEFKVYHEPYDILYQKKRPWLFATLDGRIKTEDGRSAVLEIKTSTPIGKNGWAKWDKRIPDAYLCQTLWQLLATGYDFVILYAGLYQQDGTMLVREYEILREDVADDLEWLLKEGEAFYQSIEQRKIPPLTIVV